MVVTIIARSYVLCTAFGIKKSPSMASRWKKKINKNFKPYPLKSQ